jgi:hypothetical protein
MAGAGVRQLVMVLCPLAIQPPTMGVCFLCLLCHHWSRAAGILLPPHTVGVLRDPAPAPVIALLHFGGDLRPLL